MSTSKDQPGSNPLEDLNKLFVATAGGSNPADLKEFDGLSDASKIQMLELALRGARGELAGAKKDIAVLSAIFNATIVENQKLKAELDQMKENLEKAETVDQKTGAKSHTGFMQDLNRALAEERRHASRGMGKGLVVGAGDLNGFKRINDTLGHAAGDKALVENIEVVQNNLRPGDTVARPSGDECNVILPHANLQEAQEHLKRLEEKVSSQTLVWGEHRVPFSCTFAFIDVSHVAQTETDPLTGKKTVDIFSSAEEIFEAVEAHLVPKKQIVRAARLAAEAQKTAAEAANGNKPTP